MYLNLLQNYQSIHVTVQDSLTNEMGYSETMSLRRSNTIVLRKKLSYTLIFGSE